MLENLVAGEGVPSQTLIKDLQTLCALSAQDLAEFTIVFAGLPEDASREDATDALLKRLERIIPDTDKLKTAISVAVFVWTRWATRRLTKAQVICDLEGIGVAESQRVAATPLLDAMEGKIESLRRQMSLGFVLGTGTPKIKSAICVVDARAVFDSQEHDETLGLAQPYFNLDRLVPIVVLEMISELNGEKATHAFLMTETGLTEVREVLDRARQRLDIVKKQIGGL
jgi:hypothetical protein